MKFWKDFIEESPKVEGRYIVVTYLGDVEFDFFRNNHFAKYDEEVDYWMPIPKLPKEY